MSYRIGRMNENLRVSVDNSLIEETVGYFNSMDFVLPGHTVSVINALVYLGAKFQSENPGMNPAELAEEVSRQVADRTVQGKVAKLLEQLSVGEETAEKIKREVAKLRGEGGN